MPTSLKLLRLSYLNDNLSLWQKLEATVVAPTLISQSVSQTNTENNISLSDTMLQITITTIIFMKTFQEKEQLFKAKIELYF